jgi:hypothetical protein
MKHFLNLFFEFLYHIAVYTISGALMALPLLVLWNFVFTDIFAIKAITYVQAWAIYIIAGLLFRSPRNVVKNFIVTNKPNINQETD